MAEDDVSAAVENYLISINDERRFIDPLYQPLAGIARAYQSAPRPEGAYALVTPLGLVDNGEADHVTYGEAVILSRSREATDPALQEQPVVTERRIRSVLTKVRIDVFAAKAVDYAQVLRSAFLSCRASTDLGGILPRTVGNIDFQPQLIGQEWEGRASFEVELAGLTGEANAIDVIESGSVGVEAAGSSLRTAPFTYQKD